MTFRSLQLAFPVLVALQNAEEEIGMPHWTGRAGPWFGLLMIPLRFKLGGILGPSPAT